MDKCKVFTATVLVASLTIPTIANSALIGRLAATEGGTDYQAYYDTEADLTWLADANAAGTTMNWADANNWAASLTVDGVDGWRLANSDDCIGYMCTNSEMGNFIYNVLGGAAGSSITVHHNSSYELFSNVQSGSYWTATEYLGSSNVVAWSFNTISNTQRYDNILDEFYVWAVHTGDVSAVPIPPSVFLFGSGLIGLIGFARKK